MRIWVFRVLVEYYQIFSFKLLFDIWEARCCIYYLNLKLRQQKLKSRYLNLLEITLLLPFFLVKKYLVKLYNKFGLIISHINQTSDRSL